MVVNLEPVKQRLQLQLNKYFESQGYEKSELSSLYSIVFDENLEKGYIDIYVYAEITADEFFASSDIFDGIVQKFDKSAYFDIVEPGAYLARIYLSNFPEVIKAESILTQHNLTKLGEYLAITLEDDYDEEFWVDEIYYIDKSKKLNIEVSSDSYQSYASITIDGYSIDSYQELIEFYFDEILNSLEDNIDQK